MAQDRIVYSFQTAVEIIGITNASNEDCIEELKLLFIETIRLSEEGEFITEPTRKAEFLIKHIIKVICKFFEIEIDVFQSKTQKGEVVTARQLSHFFAKKYTKISLAKIGNKIGGVGHATVLYSIKTVKNLCDTDTEYLKKFIEIKNKIII